MSERTIVDHYGHEYIIPGPFPSIDHMKKANLVAGQNWFSKESMHYFGSRIAPGVHFGRLFITSERNRWEFDTGRSYTIRVCADDGHVSSFSEFLAFPSLRAARAAVKKLGE